METAISEGTMRLIEAGILGVFCALFIGAIVYLTNENKKFTTQILTVKDKQLLKQQETIDKQLDKQSALIQEQSKHVTEMIALYGNLNDKLGNLPKLLSAELKN